MRHGADAVIIGRKYVALHCLLYLEAHHSSIRADRLAQAAKELEAATGRKCLPAPADVRNPQSIQAAAKLAFDKFGRIDYVICGTLHASYLTCTNMLTRVLE